MPIDDDLDYDPVLLGFVIDVQWPNINTAKLQIVESIRHMESDERAYVYSPENRDIPRWPGAAVGSVANFHRDLDFNMADGIKQTLILFAQEDFSLDKYLFVVTDGFDKEQSYRVKRSLSWNEKEDCECSCHFLSVGEDNQDLNELCEEGEHGYLHVPRMDNVQEAVIAIYRTQEMPFFLKNYHRLDMNRLRKNFLAEERDSDGCEQDCESPPDAERAFLSLKREHYCPVSWGVREGDEAGEQHRHGDEEQPIPDCLGG